MPGEKNDTRYYYLHRTIMHQLLMFKRKLDNVKNQHARRK